LVCKEQRYAQKTTDRSDGIRYERLIVGAEMMRNLATDKFISVERCL
jgi:hypothetical protein